MLPLGWCDSWTSKDFQIPRIPNQGAPEALAVYLRNELKNKHKSSWCQSLNFGRIRAALIIYPSTKLGKLVLSKYGMVRLASSQHRTSPS
jgi:hypothetical protein